MLLAPLPMKHTIDEVIDSFFWLGHFRKAGFADTKEALAEIRKEINNGKEQLFTDATASYQRFNWDFRGKSLEPDGIYGHFTKASFGFRCCMHRDIGPEPFGSGQPRWDQSPTNPIRVFWSGNTLGVIDQSFYHRAAAAWMRVCGVTIVSVASKSQADIWAQSLRIDGPSNTLAWSFSPSGIARTRAKGGGHQLEQRYDPGDIALYQRQGDAEVIITHEIGHALIFDGHTEDQRDIMYPMHRGPMDFGQNEIRIAQLTYGNPRVAPPPPPPPDGKFRPEKFYIAGIDANGRTKLSDQPITFNKAA